MMIWRKYGCNEGLKEHSVSQSSTTTKKEHAQRDLQHGALQELEAPPPVVRLVGTSLCGTMTRTDVCWFTSTIAAASCARKVRSIATSPGMEPF